MRRIISVLFFSFIAMTMFAQKYKTINVVPDNASIIMRGSEVGTGSYDLEEAKEMCRENGYKLIAVIDISGDDPVCVDEIEM